LTKINFFYNPLNRYEKITNNPGITKPMHKVANKVALLAHHQKHAIPRRFLPPQPRQQEHPSRPARKANQTRHTTIRKIQNTPPIDQGREITGKKNNTPKDTTTTHKAIVASLL
jgi:hypothetical protein